MAFLVNMFIILALLLRFLTSAVLVFLLLGNYVLNYLGSRPKLIPFVRQALIQVSLFNDFSWFYLKLYSVIVIDLFSNPKNLNSKVCMFH